MTTATPIATGNAPLLPVRHPNQDFFICDVLDAIPKDDMASMEHPIFSLSTRPDTRVLEYTNGDTKIEIAPSVKGLATIHDKDILIYCISQLIAGMNDGAAPSRTLHIKAFDLLVSTNRETSGNGYRRLKEAFERLRGTSITTNIQTKDEEITSGFGLIDSWKIVRRTNGGRMVSVSVTLSEWMYNAVLGREVLTLHRDYFRLRKPLERRVYEIARKHCGRQNRWKVGLALLQKKCGSNSPLRTFRMMVRTLVEHDHLPDYAVALEGDTVVFENRSTMQKVMPARKMRPLDPETLHDARTVAGGLDVYMLEQEWRNWWAESGYPTLHSPDEAFIAFCKKRGNTLKGI
ncbi:MAG: replication initiator protein A [Cognatishimia sp.]|uniref:replication initiator protein A n=1 Tax=Cognatishimia sp. TaxID=2211648 RepID=UPI00405901EC